MGNEFLFQMLAQQNVETLNASIGAERKIVATCPHCFNTLANEYPQLGGDYEVVHHTQLLGQLVARGPAHPGHAGRPAASPTTTRATSAGTTRSTRRRARCSSTVPGLRQQEMHRCKERGFCCGAGGARMWMEEKIGKRINVERIDEALALDPDVVSTACPFCMIMLTDAVTAKKQAGEAARGRRGPRRRQILRRSLAAPSPPPEAEPEPVPVAD